MAKKKAAKPRRLQSPPFTPVEDYYLTGNAGHVPAGEIAEALGRSLSEVEARMRQLDISPEEATKKVAESKVARALKGSGVKVSEKTGEVQAIVYTEARGLMDDQAARAPRRKNLHDQFRHKT